MSDTNMNYLYTAGAYAALIGLGYVLFQISTQKGRKRLSTQAKASKAVVTEGRKEDRKKKQRLQSFTSEAQESSKSKAKAPVQEKEPEQFLSNAPEKDESASNRQFAKDLAKAKEGTKFSAGNDSRKQREKSVKQSRANKVATVAPSTNVADAEDKTSAQSSTTGADADDDQSPAGSPETPAADASGVADMLEPARSSGPSILRLTDTAPKNQKPKAAKAPEQVESKKQRQNRKKAEAAKAARQEAEQDRKTLEEKQRRQARVAEGRAAKDGSQFMASNGNKSAWTQGTPNGATNTSDKVSVVPDSSVFHAPLDTYEKPATNPPKEQPAASKSEKAWISSLPSEEEQMELLKETDDWSTVKTKASKKATKKGSSVESGDETASRPSAQPKQFAAAANKSSKPAPTQSFGSFSALTTKDEPADDAEVEWEV